MIEIRDLHAWYGHVPVLRGISLDIEVHNSLAILGRNGMGKTSLLRCMVGQDSPHWIGSIKIGGRPVRAGQVHAVVARGFSYVPEERGLFRSLTVAENLRVARRFVDQPKWPLERITEMFPVLRERNSQLAGTLSGGQQQMLALGRALANEPEVLVLDEPSFGLAPAIIDSLQHSLVEIAASGVTIITVEQHLSFALKVSDTTVVIEKGRIVARSPSADLIQDPGRVEAMLGLRRAEIVADNAP